MKLRVSFRADQDIDGIWDFIARDNAEAANRVEEEIQEAMRSLLEFPGLGHLRSDLNRPHRFRLVRSYFIVYRIEDETLIVSRVIHAARNISDDMLDED